MVSEDGRAAGYDVQQVGPGLWRAYLPGIYNDLPIGYSPPAVGTLAEALALLPAAYTQQEQQSWRF